MRDPKDTSPLRVLDVIESCKTPEQIESAKNYAHNWMSVYSSARSNPMPLIMFFTSALIKQMRKLDERKPA